MSRARVIVRLSRSENTPWSAEIARRSYLDVFVDNVQVTRRDEKYPRMEINSEYNNMKRISSESTSTV